MWWPSGRLFTAVAILLGAAPLLLAWPVPLQDWPNHVAGAHVLAALLDGDPFWSRFYRVGTFLVPNAAVDLALLGLRWAGVPEAAAANLFLLATYGVFVAGFTGLARALAADDPSKPVLAVLLFYGAALFWGLANYVLAVGAMWGLLALWLAAAGRPAARAGLAIGGAAALLFIHAVPAVVFPILLGCLDLVRLRDGARPLSCLSAPLALAVVVTGLRALPGQTGHDLGVAYAGAQSLIGFLLWKGRAFATSQSGGGWPQEVATALAWAVVVAGLARATRRTMRIGAAIGVAALVTLTLVAPERVGGGSLLDVRLATLPLMLGLAAIRPRFSGEQARRWLAALTVAVLGRTACIAVEWRVAASVYRSFDAQVATLPRGSLMMMGHARPLAELSWSDVWDPPVMSIGTTAVAHGLFYPALFANPDQQPITLRAPFHAIDQPWDFADPSRAAANRTALRDLCAGHAYPRVFITMRYAGMPFRILDACDLPPPFGAPD